MKVESIVRLVDDLVKILAKVLFGLFLLVFIFLLLVHTPVVQRRLTDYLSEYFTARTQGFLAIERLDFSLLGEIEIHGVVLSDPNQKRILSAESIQVAIKTLQLLLGKPVFGITIDGLDCQLSRDPGQLNIQFLMDAFAPAETNTPGQVTAATSIRIDPIELNVVHFEYISDLDSLELIFDLERFRAEDIEVLSNPTWLKADELSLKGFDGGLSIRATRTSAGADTLPTRLPLLDFGTDADLDIGRIELENNNFFYHRGEISTLTHFNVDHLDFKGIQGNVLGVLWRKDSLALEMDAISAKLPGLHLTNFQGRLGLNLDGLQLAGMEISSPHSSLQIDATANYRSWPDLIQEWSKVDLDISSQGSIQYQDVAYFLGDSIPSWVNHWLPFDFGLDARYSSGTVAIGKLSAKTQQSRMEGEGILSNLLDPPRIKWQDVAVSAALGLDFLRAIDPFVQDFKIPSDLEIQLVSSGTPADFALEASIMSSLGRLQSIGSAGLGENRLVMDMDLDGHRVELGRILESSWLGPSDFSVHARGSFGESSQFEMEGMLADLHILEHLIHEGQFQGRMEEDSLSLYLSILDSVYRADIVTDIAIADSTTLKSRVQFDHFGLGILLGQDSSLQVTGDFASDLMIKGEEFQGFLNSGGLEFTSSSIEYSIDSVALGLDLTSTAGRVDLHSSDFNGHLEANFALQDIPDVLDQVFMDYTTIPDSLTDHPGDRTLVLDLEILETAPLQLLGIAFEDFSGLEIALKYQGAQELEITASSGDFKGLGFSLDTLHLELKANPKDLHSSLSVEHLFYDTLLLGNLDWQISQNLDTIASEISLVRDTVDLLGVRSIIDRTENGLEIHLHDLIIFGQEYLVDKTNPIRLEGQNVFFNQFIVAGKDFQLMLDGDPQDIRIEISNADLTNLNYLVSSDSSIINKGYLNGSISYQQSQQQIDLTVLVDSLVIYDSPVVTVDASAHNQGSLIPFHFNLASVNNKIRVRGEYSIENSEVYGTILWDINDLQSFQYLVAGTVDEIGGKIKGETSIAGPLDELKYDGSLRFQDIQIVTSKTKAIIRILDEDISLNNSGIFFDDFKIQDIDQNPFTINGVIRTPTLSSLEYDLRLTTNHFILVKNPPRRENRLQGILVIGSDISLKGTEKDTYVEASITIKDSTNLTYVMPSEDIELITSEGIVEFRDPNDPADSIGFLSTDSYYDSLIANLPKFDFTSKVNLKDGATLKVIVDPRSGDYLELSGRADLQFSFDQAGNPQLWGLYTITKGFYQLSFYDIVKKKFEIKPGSSVTWSGIPNDGDLNIRAVHTIRTSSTGLIGHEIAENEKSLYRRPLPYEVGIQIEGLVETPQVSFSLDLPPEDKADYPVLATKLDRLRQPEFESELNKQVFGLLVLGGFIPESGGSDFNQGLIATTALSNSVNSMLASQLNRFGEHYVRGLDIDVGLQSYSDYATGSGQTRTAMDFKVVKRMMEDRLSVEVGGSFDLNSDQATANTGNSNFRSDIAVIYDLTDSGNKKLKVFNNETYDIIYHEVRNTGISLIFLREFDKEKDHQQK